MLDHAKLLHLCWITFGVTLTNLLVDELELEGVGLRVHVDGHIA